MPRRITPPTGDPRPRANWADLILNENLSIYYGTQSQWNTLPGPGRGTTSNRHTGSADVIMPVSTSDPYVDAVITANQTCGGVVEFRMDGAELVFRFSDQCTRVLPNSSLRNVPPSMVDTLFPLMAASNSGAASAATVLRSGMVPSSDTTARANTPVTTAPTIDFDLTRYNSARAGNAVGYPANSRIQVTDATNLGAWDFSRLAGSSVRNSLTAVGVTVPREMEYVLGRAVAHTFSNVINGAVSQRERIQNLETDIAQGTSDLRDAIAEKETLELKLARFESFQTAVVEWKNTPNKDRELKFEKFNAMMELAENVTAP